MRIAIIGVGVRCRNLYLPAIQPLREVDSIGLWSRSPIVTMGLPGESKCFQYSSLEEVLEDKHVDLLIVCPTWTENGKLYSQLSDYHAPVLIETPLGTDLDEAMAVASTLAGRKQLTVVAEQYHLRPVELLKREMIKKGCFGDVLYAFNDGMGHEYHGVSLIRSLVGMDRRIVRAQAVRREFPCHPHRDHAARFAPSEIVEHALLEFEGGAIASYHWSWLSYISPIRGHRATGFHGTLGASWGEDMVIYSDTAQAAEPLRVERRTRVIAGLEILSDVIAWKRDTVLARWTNPVADLGLDEERSITAALVVAMLDRDMRAAQMFYSVADALRDHEVVDAIRRASGGETGPYSSGAKGQGATQ